MCLPRERACVILVSYGDCTVWWPVTFTLLTRDSLPLCVHFSWPKPDLVTSCLYDFTPFVYLYLFSFVIPRQNDKHFSNHSKTHLYRRGHLFAVFYWIRLLRVGKNSWTKTKQQVINGIGFDCWEWEKIAERKQNNKWSMGEWQWPRIWRQTYTILTERCVKL